MKRILFIFAVMVLTVTLGACDAGDESANRSAVAGAESGAVNDGSAVEEPGTNLEGDAAPTSQDEPAIGLIEDYSGALTVMAQLALGTVQLEDSDLAVDEAQAAELLPLWQALQSLSQSDSTADIELQAVVKQLSSSMSTEQIAAIAEMNLTEDKLNELRENGDLGLGGFGRGSGEGGGQGGGFRGGGPGGGLLGGGPGGGGGPGSLGGGNFSEEDLATRRAQFEEGGAAMIQDRLLTGVVIRLLEDKTGVVSERQIRGQIMNDAFAVVAEAAGLSVEELSEQTADGQLLANVVEANGGDVDALAARLEELFGGLPEAEELDLQQATADWLGIEANN